MTRPLDQMYSFTEGTAKDVTTKCPPEQRAWLTSRTPDCMRALKLTTAIALLFAAGFWLWLRFLIWEPSGLEQGTIAYWLKVPGAIRSMNLWHKQGNPRYDVRVGDGPSPAYVRVQYQAAGSLSSLQSAVASDGFACTRSDSAELFCERRKGAQYDQLFAQYDWKSDTVTVRAEFSAP